MLLLTFCQFSPLACRSLSANSLAQSPTSEHKGFCLCLSSTFCLWILSITMLCPHIVHNDVCLHHPLLGFSFCISSATMLLAYHPFPTSTEKLWSPSMMPPRMNMLPPTCFCCKAQNWQILADLEAKLETKSYLQQYAKLKTDKSWPTWRQNWRRYLQQLRPTPHEAQLEESELTRFSLWCCRQCSRPWFYTYSNSF